MSKSNIEEVIGLLQSILGILLIQNDYVWAGTSFLVLSCISFIGSLYYGILKARRERQEPN